MKSAVVVFTVASAIAAACRAASPAPLPESLLACAKIADPGVRVRCYDSEIAAITHPVAMAPAPAAVAPPLVAPTTAAPAVAAPPAATVQTTPPSPASATPAPAPAAQFGEEQLPVKSRPNPAPKDEALLSSITEVRTIGQKIYLISLANGQVWRQEGSQLPALFRKGNEVRIEKGALGSYHLSATALGDKNWVLVKRVL